MFRGNAGLSAGQTIADKDGNSFTTNFNETELGQWKVKKCHCLNKTLILGPLKRENPELP